jgi:hypothetical protein
VRKLQYYAKTEKIVQYSGSRNESALRSAFEELVNGCCESKSLLLINELEYRTAQGNPLSGPICLKPKL